MTRFALAVLGLCAVFAASAVEIGQVAPETRGDRLLYDQTLDLAELRGKTVLLDFWASWCGPCKQSLPMLDQMRSDLVAGGYPGLFEIVAVNLDENPEAARRFLKRYPVSYPVISDPEASLATVYKIPTMPTSFIINPQGVVTWRHEGFRPSEISEIRKQLVQTMNGQP
ncbi:MAG: TlpA disulfide reductase family protein [Abyssibacter sp.]|uniref:TlpA family protein disulfide reductase n=1 Tax=Abyssibacter sp. TaxID=2320200 RepID=UPI002EADF25B|nr:TlpA disulfide reductase family protein [Pseudomonadota bacterium]